MLRPSPLRVAVLVAIAIEITSLVAVSANPLIKPLVQPKPHARASLTPAGPWLRHPTPTDPHSQSVTELMDDRGQRLRIRIYPPHAQLQLYIPRNALDTEIVHTTVLRVTPTKTPPGNRDARATLAPSTVVRVIARRHGTAEVSLTVPTLETAGTIQLHGFVPVSSIGTRCQPRVVKSTQLRARPRPVRTLPADFALRPTPTGKPFAIGHRTGSIPVNIVARSAGHALVHLNNGGVEVTGWIDAQRLRPYRAPPSMLGGLIGGPDAPRQRLLYDAPHGHHVGALLDPTGVVVTAHRQGWVRYDLATRFGVAQVWAVP